MLGYRERVGRKGNTGEEREEEQKRMRGRKRGNKRRGTHCL